MTTRVAVLASGGGTNLQAMLDYRRARGAACGYDVVLVASNRADAGVLERARASDVATATIADPTDGSSLVRLLETHGTDLVVLAGYLKLVPAAVVHRWSGRIVNVHPALLPSFGGAGMYGRRVHEAVLRSGAAFSGPTVHLVDEEYDRGAILAQWPVNVRPDDTVESLAARVLRAEHLLLPRVVSRLALHGVAPSTAPDPPGAIDFDDDAESARILDRLLEL